MALLDLESFLRKLFELHSGMKVELANINECPEFSYRELCSLVIRHFYADSVRPLCLSGFKFEVTNFFGPHPLIKNKSLNLNQGLKRLASRFRKFFHDQLSHDVYLTLCEVLGEEAIKIEVQANKEKRA